METGICQNVSGRTTAVIQLSKEVNAEIRQHGIDDFPYECCGVLLGRVQGEVRSVTRIQRLDNVHEDGHERRFLIAPEQMFQLDKQARTTGDSIIGFYHSHPNHPARPSEYDREWAWPWYSYIILSVMQGTPAEMNSWVLDEDRTAYTAEEIAVSE